MLRDPNFNASGPFGYDEVEAHLEQLVRSKSAVRHHYAVVEVLESTRTNSIIVQNTGTSDRKRFLIIRTIKKKQI